METRSTRNRGSLCTPPCLRAMVEPEKTPEGSVSAVSVERIAAPSPPTIHGMRPPACAHWCWEIGRPLPSGPLQHDAERSEEFISLETWCPRQRPAEPGSGGPILASESVTFSLGPHTVGRTRSHLWDPFIRTLISFLKVPLTAESPPCALPQTPSLWGQGLNVRV